MFQGQHAVVLKLQRQWNSFHKPIVMQKIFLFLFVAALFACNNSSRSGRASDSTKKTAGLPSDSMAREATFSFIDGCMENSKLTLGDQKAFAFCKCIYDQLKAQNPGADSLEIDRIAMDTARLAKMAANCRQ